MGSRSLWMLCQTVAVVMVALVGFVGCGTVSTVGYPTGDGTYMVMRTITDPHSMTANQQRNWLEVCATKTHKDYLNCTMIPDTQQYTSTQGYFATIAGPAMYSGAIVGGSYYLGKGISKSGSVMNNSTSSGAGASASSDQSQSQKSINMNESQNGKGYQFK